MLLAFLLFLGALWVVTLVHELGHALAVRAKGGRVVSLRVGRGGGLTFGTPPAMQWTLGLVPVGGRIRFEGVAPGTGRAVVAAAGPAANLLLAWALLPGAAAVAEWIWLVPGATVELMTRGGSPSLVHALGQLGGVLASATPVGFLRGVGGLSALWAALNLLPLPGLTDGWAVLQGVRVALFAPRASA
jgi:membrane-associated protease RseP (regulator of RpoE activity)